MANPINEKGLVADADGKPMLSDQQALVADAAFSDLDTTDTYTDAAVNAVFAEVETKINAILDVLEAHGLMADA
jgi:hypothetical protein